MKLFVYGTLKRGFGNHFLLRGAKFLREDSFKGQLYTSGIPFAIPGDGVVHGEVFDVPAELVPRLDSLEGHPDGYTRTEVSLHSGEFAEVYLWFHGPRGELVPDGRYSASHL